MQANNTIKIIFFDIDDTLYIKNEQRVPNSVFDVIERLKQRNIIPAIATGRTFSAFPETINTLRKQTGIDVFVTINGLLNFYQDKIISQYPLSINDIEAVIKKLTLLKIEYAFVCYEEIAVSADNEQISVALSPIKSDYIVDPQYYLHHPVYQLLAFYPPEREQEVIQAGVLADNLKSVRWHPFSVDILNKNYSKAQGIDDVLRYFDLTAENAMAFGDGLNDIEMLSNVGIGVAVGNAHSDLKKVADYVALPITEDGIKVALETMKII